MATDPESRILKNDPLLLPVLAHANDFSIFGEYERSLVSYEQLENLGFSRLF
jgi:hypothetical protein